MLTLDSPSKINLFLRITERRSDGYHEIATLLQAIDFCDTLHFSLTDRDQIICNDPSIPTDQTNLVLKAADLFRRKTGKKIHISVNLEKQIPPQAGLGGGSGNAATTLWALNELCGKPASQEDLAAWSSEIGSDIPFFFSSGTAYCTGRGEILRPLEPLSKQSLWIVKPSQGLSTPQVYRALNVANLHKRDANEVLTKFLEGSKTYFNDLEEPAFTVMPSLAELKTKLESSGFSKVLLSGSGSAFFCLGNGTPLNLPGLTFYSARFMQRSLDGWFDRKSLVHIA